MTVIKVTAPLFQIDESSPEKVYYNSIEGVPTRVLMVQDFAHGFPEIKDDEILYEYKNGRGTIYKRTHHLWEILVPASKGKNQFSFEHHKDWDEYVKSLSGGLTILKTAKGFWFSPDGTEYEDRIIPVRISCNREVIEKIIDFTITHYKQEAVMCYKISDTVIIKHKKDI